MKDDDFKVKGFDVLKYRKLKGLFFNVIETMNIIQDNYNNTYSLIDEIFPNDIDRDKLKQRFEVRLLSKFPKKNTFIEAMFDFYDCEISNKQRERFDEWFDLKMKNPYGK